MYRPSTLAIAGVYVGITTNETVIVLSGRKPQIAAKVILAVQMLRATLEQTEHGRVDTVSVRLALRCLWSHSNWSQPERDGVLQWDRAPVAAIGRVF